MLPVAIAHQSLAQSAVVFFFLILGILLLNYAFSYQKAKRPMPALPPLVLAVILGYVVALFW
jgi:RsiW-degrading membrane proteinase PrsW (M82 family)